MKYNPVITYSYRIPQHVDLCAALHGMEALLEDCVDLSNLVAKTAGADSSEPSYIFRRSPAGGWDIRFEGHDCGPCNDSRGLNYLKHLLQNTNKTISAIELSAVVQQPSLSTKQQKDAEIAASMIAPDDPNGSKETDSLSVSMGGDAGEVIDDQARQQYASRYKELSAQLEEAEAFGDAEKAQEIREEMEFFTKELSRASRPGGRKRRDESIAKLAYDAVRKAIRSAQKHLEKHCSAVGQHIKEYVQYLHSDGWRYQPPEKIDWKF